MKSQFKSLVLAAVVSSLAGSLTLNAQNERAVAHIPFAFQASHVTLPAGDYNIVETGTNGHFRVSDAAGHGVFVVMIPEGNSKPSNPKLTFLCSGEQRILSQLWTGSGSGYAVTQSSIDKDINRRLGFSAMISVPLTPR
jgi:hypothetical protein